jgi:ABC-type phosphate transport system substrate-binding protein
LASDAGNEKYDEQSSSLASRSSQEAVVSQHGLRLGFCVALSLVAFHGSARADAFVFIKSAQNSTDQAGKEELKEIFTGKKGSWKGGQKIEIGIAPNGSAELKWVAQELIGASEDILLAKIKQEVFKGDMKKPTTLGSAAECIAFVKKSAGGVCVVDADSAKSLPDGVAVLKYNK